VLHVGYPGPLVCVTGWGWGKPGGVVSKMMIRMEFEVFIHNIMKKQKYLVIIVPILLLIGGVYYFSRGQVSVFNVHSLLIQKDIKTYTISSAGIATGRFI